MAGVKILYFGAKLTFFMFSPDFLYAKLQCLARPAYFCIAYSGGLDSHVLLHALAQLRINHPEIQLRAVHVDHGLSPNAKAWRQHCQQVCADLAIVFAHYTIDPQGYDPKSSLEEAARQQRYQIFAEILQPEEYLLTAHHQDDQAETVLLRLFRGAGPKGLAAMHWQRPLGKGTLVRPLLDISRAELESYAKQQKLIWIEDESNQHMALDRNYLRHQVLPLIQARWSNVALSLARTAKHCDETEVLLAALAAEDMQKVPGRVAQTLSIAALQTLRLERQKNVLRFWLNSLGFCLPSTKKLLQLVQDCLTAKEDAAPLLAWQGVEIRRFQGDLYAMAPLWVHDPSLVASISWDKGESVMSLKMLVEVIQQEPSLRVFFEAIQNFAFNNSKHQPRIAAKSICKDDLDEVCISPHTKITLRFRQGGEVFHPVGRMASHPLKKLFQEWQVPPWLRNRIPLIYFDDELVIVVGYALSQKYVSDSRGRDGGVLLQFNPGLLE
jgi:tRNA(Ile)-lysidine synthase